MFDACGLEDDGVFDIELIEHYWHGLSRHVPAPLVFLNTGTAGHPLRQGAAITGPNGTGEVFVDCDSGTIHVKVASGTFAAGETIGIGALALSVTGTSAWNGHEVRVTTDTNAVDHLLYRSLNTPTLPLHSLAWKFGKPGLPAAPAVEPGEAALGMELRNFVLAPNGLGWADQYGNAKWMSPVVDDNGDTWLITGFQGAFQPDRSGGVDLTVLPRGASILGEPAVTPTHFVTSWAAGTWPADLSSNGGTARWDLMGIKDNGRTWLFRVIGGAGLGYRLGGIFEIRIAGTWATGLTCTVHVLKTRSETRLNSSHT